MSKIIPFKALLPKQELAVKMVCPPYDVITSDEARSFCKGNPYSLLHVTKAEVDFPPDVSEYDEKVYAHARGNFAKFQKEGWLVRDAASLYIYRLEMNGHIQTGLVCGASVDEYDNDLIRKHEKTRKEKEDDRTKFAYTIGAHAEPVIIVFKALENIKKLFDAETKNPPLFDVTDHDDVRHTLWRVKDQNAIVDAFEKVPALYIADGHHRSATASRVRAKMKEENPNHTGAEPYNYFPVVLFPDNEVKVFQYDWDGDPKKRPIGKVTMDDIMKLADEHGIMPPKSTWFAPKLASGLFVYTLK